MNIYELASKTGVALVTLRKLEKAGVLKLDSERDLSREIRFHLSKNVGLTVAQLFALIEEPDALGELGRYEARAREQIAGLGDVRGDAAPRAICHRVTGAAQGDKAALDDLGAWVRSVVPAQPVSYHWLAARLLLNQFPDMRAKAIHGLNLAFAKLRATHEMTGWWHHKKISGRVVIIYQKPLDL